MSKNRWKNFGYYTGFIILVTSISTKVSNWAGQSMSDCIFATVLYLAYMSLVLWKSDKAIEKEETELKEPRKFLIKVLKSRLADS